MEAHYGENGLSPTNVSLEMGGPALFSFHFLYPHALAYHQFLFYLAGLSALACVVGFFTPIFWCLSWLFLVSTQNRNLLILNSGDDLLRLLFFWGHFLPLGNVFSWDAGKRNRERVGEWASLAWKLQLSWMYAETWILKDGHLWRAGLGAYHALSDIQFTTWTGTLLLHWIPSEVWIAASHGTLWVEIILPLLLLVPAVESARYPGWRWITLGLRGAGILLLVMLHVGFGLTLELGFFPYIPMAAALACLPREFWEFLPRLPLLPRLEITYRSGSPADNFSRHGWMQWFGSLFGIHTVISLTPGGDTDERNGSIDWLSLLYGSGAKVRGSTLGARTRVQRIGYFLCHPGSLFLYYSSQGAIRSVFLLMFSSPFLLFVAIVFPTLLRFFLVCVVGFLLPIALWSDLPGASLLDQVIARGMEVLVGIGSMMNQWQWRHANRRARQIVCVVFLLYVALQASRTYNPHDVPGWSSVAWVGTTFRLDQYWAMFAPNPPSHTGYWSVQATRHWEDGSETSVNLFPGFCAQLPFAHCSRDHSPWSCLLSAGTPTDLLSAGVPLWWGQPEARYCGETTHPEEALPSLAYRGQRWRKFFMNMRRPDFQMYVNYYLEFVSSQWMNAVASQPGEAYRSLQLLFHASPITLSGTPGPSQSQTIGTLEYIKLI